MDAFVFRNNTVERFFPKGYAFSGYDDISIVPEEAGLLIWFYQHPVKFDEELLCEEIRGYLDKLDLVLGRISAGQRVILFTMDSAGAIPLTSGALLQETVSAYNAALLERRKKYSCVEVVDLTEFTRQYPSRDLTDWKYWFISQMSLNPRLSKEFLVWFQQKLNQIALKRKKCLVLDLDNTLWGGVLGEEGVQGIQIGGDYPGKAFHLFQEALKELTRLGVMLAICSKNNEADVWEAFEKNPFMVLRQDDFVAWRIDWNDKAANIRELAEELNVGLDSLVFVDDNPSERELVRQTLPMVAVPEFPEQPYGLIPFFRDVCDRYFRVFSITAEDREKTAQYRANAKRAQSRQAFTDLRSFLESLSIHMDIMPADDFNIPRIAQLTQKTNQFNLTTRRYTEPEVRNCLASGWNIRCLQVSDRFGDSGIVGCVFLHGNEIDTLLLSCRVLGKGIEEAFLKYVLQRLRDQGVRSVTARYIPTAKNGMARDFYEKCGFQVVSESPVGEKTLSLDLMAADLTIAAYYRITMQS